MVLKQKQLKSSEETGVKQKKDTKFKKGQLGNPKNNGNKSALYQEKKGGKFKKGNPGGGRTKGTFSLLSILKRDLQKIPPELKGKERKTYADILIKKQLHKAIVEGDEQSIKLIWNYIEGQPKGSLELEIPEITKELQETRKILKDIFNEK